MTEPAFYLYRAFVTEFPVGAIGESGRPDPTWRPDGWIASEDYQRILGTTNFVWPVTHKRWFSRSTAAARVKLLQAYGAKAEVQRSSPITWPARPDA